MDASDKNIFVIPAPLLNVNEESVTCVEWRAAHGSRVNSGDCVCVIETAKAVQDVFAEQSGVLFQAARSGGKVRCGDPLGYIGKDLASIEAGIKAMSASENQPDRQGLCLTPKAKKLCEKHNVDISALANQNIQGSIKESDVLRYLGRSSQSEDYSAFPAIALPENAEKVGPLPKYAAFVAKNLSAAQQNGIFASIETQIELKPINDFLLRQRQAGQSVSHFHIFVYAISRALARYPAFCSFHLRGEIYRYQSIDIGFVAKAFDKKLYVPVIRGADKLGLMDIAKAGQELTLKASRNKLDPADIGGACLNISFIPNDKITRFTALPEPCQSSIVALAINPSAGRAIVTLNYDHTILDGWEAANFLSELHVILEELTK